MFGNILDA